MSKQKHFFTIGKLLGFYGAVLIALFLWDSGYDAARHHYFSMVLDLVIAAFGIGFLAIMALEHMDEAAHRAIHEVLDDIKDAAEKAISEKKSIQGEVEHDIDLAHAIAVDILQGEKREATPEEVARIEQEFHNQTDGTKYLKVHASSDEGMEMEISSEPIEAKSAVVAQEAAQVVVPARRQIPVIDGDEPAAKPLTKSQQRRINSKKGLGPITDDEVREQKNAKRRAARAAKKAGLEQTKLI